MNTMDESYFRAHRVNSWGCDWLTLVGLADPRFQRTTVV